MNQVKAIFFFLFVLFFLFTGCAKLDPRLQQSSASDTGFSYAYSSFAEYLEAARKTVTDNRVFFSNERRAEEIQANSPFELVPNKASCGPSQKGVLVVHGLSGSPFSILDLARYFQSRCFLVRAILLPGHGTRAGDLLKVTYADWSEAVNFGISSLKREVEKVFITGFSLGGALAVKAAMQDKNLKGVILFAPALSLSSKLIWAAPFIKHFITWLDTDPPEGYARYEAMPMNAVAETYRLTQHIKSEMQTKTIRQPLFIAQSMNDSVIDPIINLEFFIKNAASPKSVMLNYEKTQDRIDKKDSRIYFHNSHFPERKIVNFSHLAVHTAPAHPHYGENGDFRQCEQEIGNKSLNEVYLGELAGLTVDFSPFCRLTFNPRYHEMLELLDDFLASIE